MKSRTFEVLAAGIVVVAWVVAAHAVQTLPERISTHFRWDGTADATGPASSVWVMPALMTGMYVFLSAMHFIPARLMNYPVRVTDRNRDKVYALGREMLPALKACTLLTLLALEWGSVDGAVRGSLGPLFTAAIFAPVALLFGILTCYTLKMRAV